MKPVARWLATVVVAGFAVVGLALPASAADEISIDHVESTSGSLKVLVSADQIPGNDPVDTESVEMSLDGRLVDAKVTSVAGGAVKRTVVLVLDTSNSMRRKGWFESATAAVNFFLDTAPADVEIGLVTFSGEVGETLAPTTDHAAVRAVLAELELGKGTAVYDGITKGLELAGTKGARSLLVLSDGADTISDSTLAVVTGAADESGVVVDVVSLAQAARVKELTALAERTGGAMIPADSAELGKVFTNQANALVDQLLLTATVPDDAGDEASIAVSLRAGDATYSDSAFASIEPAATNAAESVSKSTGALIGTPGLLLGALALAIGLGGLLAVVLTGATDTRSDSVRRLDAYFEGGQSTGRRRSKGKANTSGDIRGSAIAMADKVVTKDLETRISQRLTGAGSSMTASEWLLMHAGITVVSAFAGMILYGPLLAVLGLIVGAAVPWMYLKWRHKRRLAQFNAQLAQTLGLMAGGLQAGLSLPQAVDSVVREGHEPMAGELRRALVEQRLGIEITDALESVGQRMASADFGWVVMAIRIQREVGGNLAEILHTVADTIREREYLRRQVKALSAEGRLSGYILSGLPPLIFFYMMFANPSYVRLLYTTVPGYFLLGLALTLLALGSFAMSKLAKVEV